MALTAAEEAQTRELLAQQAAILSLADSEAAIISSLGATDVSLSDLTAATTVNDSDLLLVRQGVTDKSVSGAIIKGLATVPDASETVKGIVELATVAEANAGTDTVRAVTPAGLASRTPAIKAQSPLDIAASATLDSTHVGRPLYYSGASAGTLILPASPLAGDAITVYVVGTGDCTIQRNSAQTIYAQGRSAVTSIVLNTGASVTLLYDGSAWVQAAGNNSVGYGQSWQDVTGSRVVDTTYYNTTGKPIEIAISVFMSQITGFANILVNGSQIENLYGYGQSCVYIMTAVVPPGASYSLTTTNANIQRWSELR